MFVIVIVSEGDGTAEFEESFVVGFLDDPKDGAKMQVSGDNVLEHPFADVELVSPVLLVAFIPCRFVQTTLQLLSNRGCYCLLTPRSCRIIRLVLVVPALSFRQRAILGRVAGRPRAGILCSLAVLDMMRSG